MPYPDNMPFDGGPYARALPPLLPHDAERVDMLRRISDDASQLCRRIDGLRRGDLDPEHRSAVLALCLAANVSAIRIENDSEREWT